MAPALGFDEVPGDVAATLAAEGLERPRVILTYALPSAGSNGTIKSGLGILAGSGPWVQDGKQVTISAGDHSRWSPMPPPLGPKPAISFPIATGNLIPLHIELDALELYVTIGTPQRLAVKFGLPLLRAVHSLELPRKLMERAVETVQRSGGPERAGKAKVVDDPRGSTLWRPVAQRGDCRTRRVRAHRSIAIAGRDDDGSTVI